MDIDIERPQLPDQSYNQPEAPERDYKDIKRNPNNHRKSRQRITDNYMFVDDDDNPSQHRQKSSTKRNDDYVYITADKPVGKRNDRGNPKDDYVYIPADKPVGKRRDKPVRISSDQKRDDGRLSGVLVIRDYDEYVEYKKRPKGIVMYSAKNCPACDGIKGLYGRIGARYRDRICLAFVDIDELKLEFSQVPVFVAHVRGEEFDSMLGADADGLKQLVKKTILAK